MKAKALIVALCLLFPSSFAMAQGEEILQKFYAGALYTGSFSQYYPPENYQPVNDVNLLVGARTKISLAPNLFVHTRITNNINGMGAHIWVEEKINWASFNAGFFPLPIGMIYKPEPISKDWHFLPASKSVIPGPAFGAMAKLSSAKLNSDFFAGVYRTRENFLELNLGLVKNFPSEWLLRKVTIGGYSEWLLHKVAISGYSNKGVSGVAIGIDIWRLSLMGFSGMDAQSIRTRSIYAETKFREFNLYIDAVNRKNVWETDVWETAELGITKEMSEKFPIARVNYLYGLGYIFRQKQPDTINFYLQIWIDKK